MVNMNTYTYRVSVNFQTYHFTSEGPKGRIQKIAKFRELDTNVFSFGFGDLDMGDGNISDRSTSNNGDAAIIIGTLGNIIYDFSNIYHGSWILIQGTNAARTRLYQQHINKHLEKLVTFFLIWGLKDGKWEDIKPRTNYLAFIGRRKVALV